MTDLAVTASIAAIPPRVQNGLLARAVASVAAQEYPVSAISVAVDGYREGAPATKQRALDAVLTPFVAFLDDDDEWLPQHVGHLMRHLQETEADLVYSWYTAIDRAGNSWGDVDPVFPASAFHQPFDPNDPIEITSVVLVKTDLAQQVGFRRLPDRQENTGEDWGFLQGILALGAKVEHLVERTWLWHHDSHNTSGMPDRW